MSDNTRGPENQEPGSGDSPFSDETRQWSRDDLPPAGPVEPAGEPTTVLPPVPPPAGGPEHTSVLPPAGVDPWTGRAEVRPGGPVRGAVPPADDGEEPEPGGKWWLPVVLAIVGLLLLLAIGVGTWLVLANSDEPAPAPSPSTPQTTAARTTSAPSPTNLATSAAAAPIPQVVGLSLNEATLALDAAGLNYRLEYRATADADPGTVIGVDPRVGTQVPVGYEVLLVIASAPPPSEPASPSPEVSPSPAASAS